MLTKMKKFFQEKKKTIKSVAVPSCVAAAIACTTSTVFAVTPEQIIGKLLDGLFDIAKWIGIVLLVWGVISLILALKNEDADSKTRAIMTLAVAIGLICLGALFGEVIKLVLPNYAVPT